MLWLWRTVWGHDGGSSAMVSQLVDVSRGLILSGTFSGKSFSFGDLE